MKFHDTSFIPNKLFGTVLWVDQVVIDGDSFMRILGISAIYNPIQKKLFEGLKIRSGLNVAFENANIAKLPLFNPSILTANHLPPLPLLQYFAQLRASDSLIFSSSTDYPNK